MTKLAAIAGLLLLATPSAASDLALARPLAETSAGLPAPWPERFPSPSARRGIARGEGLIDLSQWPEEPRSPKLTVPRLAASLRQLCKKLKPITAEQYAGWIAEYSRAFEVDPFLVAALIYEQSRCGTARRQSGRIGLAGIDMGMHHRHVRNGMYHYWQRTPLGGWQMHTLDLSAFPFTPKSIVQPETNLYFAAAILSVHQRQCRHVDATFGSIPHRHAVAHWVWGDRVRDNREEDHILRARRRLILNYTGKTEPAAGTFSAIALYSPLDGWPRKVTSALGDRRPDGRHHRGVDFDSQVGEPVRAVADGDVILAGVDMRVGPGRSMSARRARRVRLSRMGPGGLLVVIRHADGLQSSYMHLTNYRVGRGQRVRAGDVIGWVGRSGIRRSVAHLHFELRRDGRFLNPLKHLGAMVFPPQATYVGRRLLAKRTQERRRRRRAARAKRRRRVDALALN